MPTFEQTMCASLPLHLWRNTGPGTKIRPCNSKLKTKFLGSHFKKYVFECRNFCEYCMPTPKIWFLLFWDEMYFFTAPSANNAAFLLSVHFWCTLEHLNLFYPSSLFTFESANCWYLNNIIIYLYIHNGRNEPLVNTISRISILKELSGKN